MPTFPPDFWYYVASGFILMLVPVGFINFWLRGFFWSFAKVKSSGGKLCLVRVRSKLRDYFRPGTVSDATLRYKDAIGEYRTVNIPEEDDQKNQVEVFYRAFGVTCIDIDETRNCVFQLDGDGVSGFDAAKFDSILQRALLKPSFGDKKLLIVLVIVIIILLVTFFSAYYGYKNNQMLQFLVNQSITAAQSRVTL